MNIFGIISKENSCRITHLREVFITMGDETNPQFQDMDAYISSLRGLPNFKSLQV